MVRHFVAFWWETGWEAPQDVGERHQEIDGAVALGTHEVVGEAGLNPSHREWAWGSVRDGRGLGDLATDGGGEGESQRCSGVGRGGGYRRRRVVRRARRDLVWRVGWRGENREESAGAVVQILVNECRGSREGVDGVGYVADVKVRVHNREGVRVAWRKGGTRESGHGEIVKGLG